MRIGILRRSLAAAVISGGVYISITDVFAIPNPAAVGCEKLGGKGEHFRGKRSDIGFCRFGDALIEQWSLYRVMFSDFDVAPREVARERAKTLRATAEFLRKERPSSVKEAATYCETVGGKTMTYVQSPFRRDSPKMVACEFDDRSTIEVETLFRGAHSPGNAALQKILLGKSTSGAKK